MAKTIGILHHHRKPHARDIAEQLLQTLPTYDALGWICAAGEDKTIMEKCPETDIVVSIGGDGTLLRIARVVAPYNTPIIGVNLGKLGFLSELSADDLMMKLPHFIQGKAWIDERAMLQVELSSDSKKGQPTIVMHALNDVVISRGPTPRIVHITACIGGDSLTTYRADGIILCTATGSTAYNLALGGPILYPQAKEMILHPIAAHLSFSHTIVLPSSANVELRVNTDHDAMLSVDGQTNIPIADGAVAKIQLSPHTTHLLRINPPSHFYSALEQRLRRSIENPKSTN
jgi:NAD+ kinase